LNILYIIKGIFRDMFRIFTTRCNFIFPPSIPMNFNILQLNNKITALLRIEFNDVQESIIITR